MPDLISLAELIAAAKGQPLWLAIGGLVGVLAGAYGSIKLVKPRSRQIVAQAGDFDSQRWDRLMERYEHVVASQDEKLAAQAGKIEDLENREEECEARAKELAGRVAHLELVLKRAGLNGE